jgi:hypothetical protein
MDIEDSLYLEIIQSKFMGCIFILMNKWVRTFDIIPFTVNKDVKDSRHGTSNTCTFEFINLCLHLHFRAPNNTIYTTVNTDHNRNSVML